MDQYVKMAAKLSRERFSALVTFAVKDALNDMSKGVDENEAIEKHAETMKNDDDALSYFDYFDRNKLGSIDESFKAQFVGLTQTTASRILDVCESIK